MTLPPVAPQVVADAVAALPARLRARLDQAIQSRHAWTVTSTSGSTSVRLDATVTVTLSLPVDAQEQVVCDCLLAPRCLHRAAVLSAAPLAADTEPPTADAPETPTAGTTEPPATGTTEPPVAGTALPATTSGSKPAAARPDGSTPPTSPEIAAAEMAYQAAAQILDRGIPAAGAVTQAELLRAVHHARAVGAWRIGSAGVRVVERLRAARAGSADFRLMELADDLRDLLTASHLLRCGATGAAGREAGRRGYADVGDLRLYGVFAEPVRTASGYAGAVTYLCDGDARIWTVSQVRPGVGTGRLGDSSVELGEVRISHRELGRAGLLATGAHASADRRLGHGRAVQAVRATGRSWHEPPVAVLWDEPIGDQVGRWLAALDQPPRERVAGHDLAFLSGTVAGAGPAGLVIHVPGMAGPIAVQAPLDDPTLPYVANLRLLAAHAAGETIRLIGRFRGARLVDGLAVTAPWLPERLGGHVDLGIDRLRRADLPGQANQPPVVNQHTPVQPPLHLVEHTLHRIVAAGRTALAADVDVDLRRLRDAQMPTAVWLLQALHRVGATRSRDHFGRLDQNDTTALATAWLTAAAYHAAAVRETYRRSWQPAADP